MKPNSSMPKIGYSKVRRIFLVVIFSLLLFGGGYYLGSRGFRLDAPTINQVKVVRDVPVDKNVDFALFWKVWDTLDNSYFDKSKLKAADMVYGAISGMVAAVGDPYTVFLQPSDNKVVQEDLQGSFQGVGIQIGFRGTQLAVVAPLPDSPAEEVDIRAGDYIVGIKDEAKSLDVNTSGMTLPDAVQAIRGPSGSKVTLALMREGEETPIIVDVTRREIDVPSVVLTYEEGNPDIAHLRLLKFGGDTDAEWEIAVRDILKNGSVKGIVLDVRNNPGGYLQGSVDIAGDFLPNGSVVVKEEDGNGKKVEFKSNKIPRLAKYPMVMLVNKGSASASEILAGAMRDQAKIQIIGDTTFGKGTIQEPQQLGDGSGLHITTARWLTPSEIWVHDKGLTPDTEIADNPETAEDEQFSEAVRQLNN
jgi:carboxyl-terminal processing protease